MEADGDDTLDREDYMPFQLGRGADPERRDPRSAEMHTAKAAAFDAMDADRDGLVARGSFVGYAVEKFYAADANGDSALAPAECQAMHQGS